MHIFDILNFLNKNRNNYWKCSNINEIICFMRHRNYFFTVGSKLGNKLLRLEQNETEFNKTNNNDKIF